MMFKLTVLLYFLVYVFLGTLATFGLAGIEEQSVTVKDGFRLHSGDLMSFVGFGTYQIEGDDHVLKVLDYALAAGYRLIDSAQMYHNEESIGKALKVLLPKYNLKRKDIFITTKLNPLKLGDDDIYASIEQSNKNLDSEYLDLFLIHFPGLPERDSRSNPKNDSVLRDGAWQVLIRAIKQGLIRNIGVSNYNVRQLNELLQNDHGVKPAVNQVEWHPGYHQNELIKLCRKEKIFLQGYCSLGGTGNTDLLFNRPEVVNISKKLKKTPAQVLLRWALQQKVGIIPKSTSQTRIKENIALDFSIPEEDMKILFNLEQNKFIWNPDRIQ